MNDAAAERKLPISFVRVITQFENAGDCLINRELLRILAERSIVVLDVNGCPPAFARQVTEGIPSERLRKPKAGLTLDALVARARGQICYRFLMPGGISGSGSGSTKFRAWARDLPLAFAALAGVRTCQVGASFSDLSGTLLDTWRRRSRWLYRLSPRDSMSARHLQSLGIRSDMCIPDLAFNVFPDEDAHFEPTEGVSTGLLGLSFRTDQYPDQVQDVTRAALSACRFAGPGVEWSVFAQVGRDLRGMESIRDALLEQGGVTVAPVIDLHANVEACLACYRRLSAVVSNRLHVLLMAASQGARVLAVTQGPARSKLEGVLRDLGLADAIYHPGMLDGPGTARKIGVTISGAGMRRKLLQAMDDLVGRPMSLRSESE
jgi:polysaccharide pyruvyl transferase WcaK-like protein